MPSHIRKIEALSATSIRITFSDAMGLLAALQTAGNYTLTPVVAVSTATASSTRREVTLALGASLTQGQGYVVAVASPPITGDTDGDLDNTESAFVYGNAGFVPVGEVAVGKTVLPVLRGVVAEEGVLLGKIVTTVSEVTTSTTTTYYQRIRDLGAGGAWVQFSGSTPTNAPTLASTSPAAVGPLQASSHVILAISCE